jgi:2-polyprenyl-3-methyl-5-hydroxy-6-metoxy-1,4-benzoquinol methylase
MKNVVDERPTRDLHGRLAFSRTFVAEEDCRDKDVLDIGCGFGWFELLALDRGASSVTGVEPSEEGLATARRYLDDERVALRTASAIELPFDDGSFDTVVCWEVLEHLPLRSEGRAFREIFRVLRPGGALYLSTPHAAPLATVTDPAWWLIAHRHYSRERVAAFATQAGFDVERLETRGGKWEILRMLDLYVSKWILRRRPLFEERTMPLADDEWQQPGFTHVFVRCRRPS